MDTASSPAEGQATAARPRPRRETMAEAALQVLAEKGMRGLTHRAVDRHLALPEGSTSFYFRRRNDLLAAAARKSVVLNLAMLDEVFSTVRSDGRERLSVPAVARCLLDFWTRMMSPAMRYRVVGRTELFLEALRLPFLQEIQAGELKLLEAFWVDIFARLGAAAPAKAARAFGAVLRGAVFVHTVTPYTVAGMDLTLAFFTEQLNSLTGTKTTSGRVR